MNLPKLSIIIPVYNAENYIGVCIDSILSQDFSDFEIILINDGSTDKSPIICDEYSEIDGRIIVIHKTNGGVSSARNLGLEYAKGEWIYFVDADDSLIPSCLSIINTSPQEADIIQFGYKKIEGNNDYIIGPQVNQEFSSPDIFVIEGTFDRMSLWIHFIKSSLIKTNDIHFTIGLKYAEDLEFIIKCYACSSLIVSKSQVGYNYYVREISTMSKAFTFENAKVHLDVADRLIDFFCERKLSLGVFFQSRIRYMIKSYFSFSLNIKSDGFDKDKFLLVFNAFLARNKPKKVVNNILRKGLMIIIRINPLLYLKLMSLKKKNR